MPLPASYSNTLTSGWLSGTITFAISNAAGALNIEIITNGATAGVDFDQLNITPGSIAFNGTLNVSIINSNYTPAAGQPTLLPNSAPQALTRGTIKATCLIETLLAAFEMDEILWELREHSSGLNIGRWDYIFSCIKKFRANRDFCLADRAQVTMTAPFMRAYALLLVKTCHRRGAPDYGSSWMLRAFCR